MAVTMDIGDYNYIHPAKKQEVGDRLAYWALAETYGIKGIAFSGPVYKEMEVIDNEVHIQVDYADDGLTSFGKKLKYFIPAIIILILVQYGANRHKQS